MKIKILQVLDQLNRESGVSSVLMNYYRHRNREMFQMDFMVNRPVEQGLREEIEENGSQIFLMPELRTKHIMAYPNALRIFFKEHMDYQIVHGHVANAAAFYMKAAYQSGIKIRILHSHNSCGADNFKKKIRNYLLAQWGIKYSNYYAACGKKAAQYLYGTERGIEIIPNAVEEKRYCFQSEIREQMRFKYQLQDKYILGHIGRFCPQKNQRFLISLMEKLICAKVTHKKPHLLLIGSGNERRNILHLIKERGLDEEITCMEGREDIENYYQMMDCFLLPSLFEGVPLVGVEAQFNGLPCIFSEQITREIASEQVRYIELEQQEKWIQAIKEFENRGRRVGKLQGYQIGEAVKKLEDFYRKCYKQMG